MKAFPILIRTQMVGKNSLINIGRMEKIIVAGLYIPIKDMDTKIYGI